MKTASSPAWPVPATAYRATLHRLTGPAYRAFARTTGADDAVGPGAALAGWAADLLLGTLSDPTAVLGFLEHAIPALARHGVNLAGQPRQPGGPPVLSVVAGRYVGVTSVDGCYDVQTGEWLADESELWHVVETSLQTVSFNLRVLFLAQQERLCDTTSPSGGPTTPTPPPS